MRTLAMTVAAGMIVGAAQAQSYQQDRDRSNQQRTSRGQNQVQELNRASNFIGSEVQLREGKQGGTVKDVVIDFDSGRVAYVVVDVSSVLDETTDSSLIAVPARAFRLQNDRAVLDANQDKLQRQRTFSAGSFPALQRGQTQRMRQAWGPSRLDFERGSDPFSQPQSRQTRRDFGQSQMKDDDLYLNFYDPQQAQGTSGSAYGGYGESEFGQSDFPNRQSQQQRQQQEREYGFRGAEPQWHEELRQEYNEQYTPQDRQRSQQRSQRSSQNQGRSGGYEYDNYTYDYQFNSPQSQRNQQASTEKTRTMSGTVSSINRNNDTITIENWAGHEWTFHLPQDQRGSQTRFSQLRQGQEVKVDFAYENGEWRAFNIERQSRGNRE